MCPGGYDGRVENGRILGHVCRLLRGTPVARRHTTAPFVSPLVFPTLVSLDQKLAVAIHNNFPLNSDIQCESAWAGIIILRAYYHENANYHQSTPTLLCTLTIIGLEGWYSNESTIRAKRSLPWINGKDEVHMHVQLHVSNIAHRPCLKRKLIALDHGNGVILTGVSLQKAQL